MIESGEKLGKKWQIGLGDARHNADLIYVEGSTAEKSTVVCSVDGIYSHRTLDQIEEEATNGDFRPEEVAKGLAVARLIVMVPEMFEFVELCAAGGNSHAQEIVDAVKNGKPREKVSDAMTAAGINHSESAKKD